MATGDRTIAAVNDIFALMQAAVAFIYISERESYKKAY